MKRIGGLKLQTGVGVTILEVDGRTPLQFSDQRSAWEMDADGDYRQRMSDDDTTRSSQDTLIGVAERRLAAAEKHRERKVRSQLASHFRRQKESNRI